MAEIHRKQPLIKKRMEKWKSVVPVPEGFSFRKKEPEPKKKNVHVERLKEGGRVIGGAILGGLKNIGRELSKPETQRRVGEIGGRAGSMSSSFFAGGGGWGYEPARRKKHKKAKKSKSKKAKVTRGGRSITINL